MIDMASSFSLSIHSFNLIIYRTGNWKESIKKSIKMPDQDKKMYDHGLAGAQERYLNMYGPHSPANSDSPLSLVVRKEDALSHVSRKEDTIKMGLVDSPGRSSGQSNKSQKTCCHAFLYF